ncbi:MAG: DUF2079 domain-containing protein [Planctomyces sp.]|nr:DUF2079 domain-containing protein [Planctomyces sp.]
MPPSAAPAAPRRTISTRALVAVGSWLAALLGGAFFVQTVLESAPLANVFFSEAWRSRVLAALGARTTFAAGDNAVSVDFLRCLAIVAPPLLLLTLLGGALGHRRGSREPFIAAAFHQAFACLPIGAWAVGWLIALLADWDFVVDLLAQTVELAAAAAVALSVLGIVRSGRRTSGVEPPAPPAAPSGAPPSRGARSLLIAGMAAYVAVFVAMNFGLWFNLRIPHGDSAMYEEHLWNLEYGKGFRSYLDQGLFLGEHLQVIHVLLIPLHLLVPSHLTLEFAQSVILALGAWPVFRMARRHSGSEWAGALLGLAYLAYQPLQALDIAIDLKTFRPNSLGIPTLLAALDALEERRWRRAAIWLALTLSAQEDFAIPIALVGAWLALSQRPLWPRDRDARSQTAWGIALFVFGVAYLWLAVNVFIPWFRDGATVHFASYFSRFGSTPREIAVTLLTRPGLVLATLITPGSIAYACRLLLPVGFLPVRSPGRLLVALPLFLLLCMNDLAMETPAPVHHFHAYLVPILFWAAAAGLGDWNRDRAAAAAS